jgi:hypothetical protein
LLDEIFFASPKNSARVPQRERSLSTVADCRNPVASNARLIMNDRDLATKESIEESGLPDIRPPDDCDARQLGLSVHRDS